jgi:hypothetical protein
MRSTATTARAAVCVAHAALDDAPCVGSRIRSRLQGRVSGSGGSTTLGSLRAAVETGLETGGLGLRATSEEPHDTEGPPRDVTARRQAGLAVGIRIIVLSALHERLIAGRGPL